MVGSETEESKCNALNIQT